MQTVARVGNRKIHARDAQVGLDEFFSQVLSGDVGQVLMFGR